jgi:glucuronate isomerase
MDYSTISIQRPFLSDNFLLHSETAERLYFEYAKDMPIIDYHNHLPPDQISNNYSFSTITEAWLNGDHYKWRAMRGNGVNEQFVTGKANDYEKFEKWMETLPYTLRNPLYHWSHMEMQRYFGIHDVLNAKNARSCYDVCNEQLALPTHSVHGLLKMMNVKVVCTTDDPADSLEHHVKHGSDTSKSLKMLPSFRPDKYILIENPNYKTFVERLSNASEVSITNFEDLLISLRKRAEYFNALGCRASDHGLEYISASSYTASDIKTIFYKALNNEFISSEEAEKFKSAMLYELGLIYHSLGWAQQFHLGALRNNNIRALRTLGPDTGWDSIGDWPQAANLSKLLGRLDEEDKLAKTIIYNLNPADNELMATMIGNFNDGSVKGKIQFGSGWWFLDQKDGMEKQINTLSNMGLLSRFVGMLTDSRSFLSFPRHEYFRRILCNIFGSEIEKGELPADIEWVGKIIQDISYNNVEEYFGMKEIVN